MLNFTYLYLLNRILEYMSNSTRNNNTEPFRVVEINHSFEDELFNKNQNGIIGFCQRGKIDMLINLNLITIESNSQFIIMPNTITRIKKVSKDISLFVLEINDSLFRDVSVHINPSFFRMLRTTPCIKLSPEGIKAIDLFMTLAKGLYNDIDNLYRQQIIRSALNAFLLFTYDRYQRFYCPDEKINESARNKIFDRFIDLVHHNCSTQREVSFYADKLCISNKYLTDICHNVVGVSAKKIIDSFSILEIKVLLHNTQLSMQDIANQMAFPDQSYMGRFFKRCEGISPSTFRKQIINEMGG